MTVDPFRRSQVEAFNAQWDFAAYPTGADEALKASTSITTTAMGASTPIVTESKLSQCHGSWKWRSCTDGEDVVVGGQLAVGTVFSRVLRLVNDNSAFPNTFDFWQHVDVWAKYRVSNRDALSHIYLAINDIGTTNSSRSTDVRLHAVDNTWHTVYHSYDFTNAAPPSDWTDENLRLTLSFQGTTIPANVGEVTVDVEWLAIRLRVMNPDPG